MNYVHGKVTDNELEEIRLVKVSQSYVIIVARVVDRWEGRKFGSMKVIHSEVQQSKVKEDVALYDLEFDIWKIST